MNETMVTLVGNAATPVDFRETPTGSTARFRLAVTPRRWDREQQVWTDGSTGFYTVWARRTLAANLSGSVSVGEPLVVHGLGIDVRTHPVQQRVRRGREVGEGRAQVSERELLDGQPQAVEAGGGGVVAFVRYEEAQGGEQRLTHGPLQRIAMRDRVQEVPHVLREVGECTGVTMVDRLRHAQGSPGGRD